MTISCPHTDPLKGLAWGGGRASLEHLTSKPESWEGGHMLLPPRQVSVGSGVRPAGGGGGPQLRNHRKPRAGCQYRGARITFLLRPRNQMLEATVLFGEWIFSFITGKRRFLYAESQLRN